VSHKILISIILILLSTLPAVPQEKTEREAYRNARTAFLAAETAVKKINVLKSFAAEWPDHPVVVDFALSQAVNIYRSPLDDVAGAIEFVSSARNKTGVRSIRLGASRLLAGLYGDAKRRSWEAWTTIFTTQSSTPPSRSAPGTWLSSSARLR